VQKFGRCAQEAHDRFAVVRVDGSLQFSCGVVRTDPTFQLGPAGKTVFARDDELGVGQLERRQCDRLAIEFLKLRVPVLDPLQCFRLALPPEGEQLARFAFRNIPVGVRGQSS
jgi:hypothetical protein